MRLIYLTPNIEPVNKDYLWKSSSRSDGSEDESDRQPTSVSSESELSHSPQTQGWILVKNESAPIIHTVDLEVEQVTLRPHRSTALARCVEALALVIRDVAHVTPHNCRAAVRCVRLLARATLHSSKTKWSPEEGPRRRRARGDSSDEEIDSLDHYHMVSIQLLDLMHTLHSRTAQIFKWWRDEADQGQGAEDYDLWEVAWKPLLQGIAEFCTDRRKQVANSAIAYLQRALLAPALAALGGAGWEACFEHVLLPLLADPPRRADAAARADTVMCKVFLQHLQALVARPSFGALWARVVRVQRALLAAPAEPLREAALESLKNMLLVMHSVRIFSSGDGNGYNDLWYITWDIIGEFLPDLKDELFPEAKDNMKPSQSVPSHMQPSVPLIPTIMPVGTASAPPGPGPAPAPGPRPPPPMIPSVAPGAQNSSVPIQIQRSSVQSPNILVGSAAHSPVNLSQSPPQIPALVGAPAGAPLPAASPTFGTQPVSGMVPIRNPLYDQTALTSSVLLHPLNEMISTPIGISIQSHPILCPTADKPTTEAVETKHKDPEQSELYEEYLTNPYTEVKDLSAKEATIYDPEENRHLLVKNDQIVPSSERLPPQKSLSANVTPMHTANKAQFGSTDNVREESSIFNFSSYFGSVSEKGGAEVFDALLSTQEG
ncbi:unnamed protein product [Euphydryas editha]|uniref:GBF1-like tetratricopeptide repeats domain-containing protein n=1 Tax=Euphydryas editha TaxID=104508 RepID=A0AAU9U064_EUPED|nr:unnamed protein product [Euphydryas editha]